jgi:integrase
VPADIVLIEALIAETEARLLIIEPLAAFLAGPDANKDQDIRRVLYRLSKLAERQGCAVVTMRYPNKTFGGKAIYRGSMPKKGTRLMSHISEGLYMKVAASPFLFRRQLTRLATDLAWSTPKDARAHALTEWLAARAIGGMAPRTQNHYATRVKAFLNFCVEQGWVAENPLARVKLAKVGQKGRRRLRRAYATDELQALFTRVPEPRRAVYRVASLCGLRRKELKLLQKEDLTPIGPAPCWHMRPSIDKTGRGDRVPMLPDCADLLRPLWEAAKPGERIFPSGKGRAGIATHVTLNADLAAAGIPKVDARGRHADFHSFRYTFCSMMGRVLPIQKVKVLMRHSTISLTADLYTDLGIDDVAEGVWMLPRLNITGEFARNPESALQQAHTSV